MDTLKRLATNRLIAKASQISALLLVTLGTVKRSFMKYNIRQISFLIVQTGPIRRCSRHTIRYLVQ